MNDRPQEWRRDGFEVSTDRARLDIDDALALLHTTWWAGGMSRELLLSAVEESLVFAVYSGPSLVGLARVVTDRATYGYLTDVVIAEGYRGQGLGRWLMECVIDHRDLQGLRRLSLLTSQAPWLYEKLGFRHGAGKSTYMERPGAIREFGDGPGSQHGDLLLP